MACTPKDINDQIIHTSQFNLASPSNFNISTGKHELGGTVADGESQLHGPLNFGQDGGSGSGAVEVSAPSCSNGCLDNVGLFNEPLEASSVAFSSGSSMPFSDETLQREVPITTIVALQALLIQFSSHIVRADFINGKFGCNVNPGLLPKLDILRQTLIPDWQHGGLAAGSQRNFTASQHIQKLLLRLDQLFVLEAGDSETELTYCEWFRVLDTIATSRYWYKISAKRNCSHCLPSSDDNGEGYYTSGQWRGPVPGKP